jgi:hypothetical protein
MNPPLSRSRERVAYQLFMLKYFLETASGLFECLEHPRVKVMGHGSVVALRYYGACFL